VAAHAHPGELRSKPRFLAGFDGRDGGRDALELTRVLAAALAADVLAVTVIPYGPLPIPAVQLRDGEIPEVEALLAEARERLRGLEVETRAFGGGTPAGVLTMLAEAEKSDMIVVGSPHRGAIGRALIGSTADSLLPGAPCAVVVAPRGYAAESHDAIRLIAVAYDGSAEAKAALRRAEAVALATNAKLRIMVVVAPAVASPEMRGYVPPEPPNPDEIAAQAIRSLDPKLSVESDLLEGSPASTLARACADDVDLVIAGSHGYGPLTRVVLGSVSRRLLHEAPCPVLVVPRP
jgi:nucleotide-binding universal stress UspA family protein